MSQARKISSVAGLGPQLKEMRLGLGLGQIAFANALDVDQGSLAKWESGARPIPLPAILRIADIAPIENKKGWLEAAGLSAPQAKPKKNDGLVRPVPVLKDAAILGTVRASRPEEHEFIWEVPGHLLLSLPAASVLYAIRARDKNGMDPLIEKGFLVAVDVSQRDPKLLRGPHDRMVVFRDWEGVSIRWFRRDMGLDLLVPYDLNRHNMKVLDPKQGIALVGAVVLWMGKPPAEK